MSNAESLTAEDLRGRLYHSLREKGLVDALKVYFCLYFAFSCRFYNISGYCMWAKLSKEMVI